MVKILFVLYPNLVANNEFIISSTTIKRKREEAYITENVNHDDASDRVKFLPEWTQSLLKIHAQSGDKSVCFYEAIELNMYIAYCTTIFHRVERR